MIKFVRVESLDTVAVHRDRNIGALARVTSGRSGFASPSGRFDVVHGVAVSAGLVVFLGKWVPGPENDEVRGIGEVIAVARAAVFGVRFHLVGGLPRLVLELERPGIDGAIWVADCGRWFGLVVRELRINALLGHRDGGDSDECERAGEYSTNGRLSNFHENSLA